MADRVERPVAILLAGPNGGGKTTASRVIDDSGIRFLNADLIAAELRSAGHPGPSVTYKRGAIHWQS